jgi:predicted small metal-binding protein
VAIIGPNDESMTRRHAVKEFRCGEIVPGCQTVFHAESEEEILEEVAEHARDEHGMDVVPPEVVDEVRSRIAEV